MPTEYKLPAYTVYIDTNAAYSKKPSESISDKLLKFVEQAKVRTSIHVRIPAVVVEELTYQQFRIAQAAAENLKKNCKTLVDVCGLNEFRIPDADALQIGARKVISKVIEERSFSVLPTPVADINWESVVHDSCWRRPPFEKPKSQDDLAEKGFRDKMVLETIKIDASRIRNGVIAFVSDDNLLRKTFHEQAKAECPIELYSGFDDLLGQLELLAKTKSSQFAKEVLSKVGSVFYDPNNPDCVVLSQGVLDYLTTQYSDEMSHPSLFGMGSPKYQGSLNPSFSLVQPVSPRLVPSATWFEEYNLWTPVTPVKLFASPPVFQSSKEDGRYHWISTVTLVRLLRRTEPRPGQAYGLPEERIRTKDVDVKWSCNIHPHTAEFSNALVEGYAPMLNDSFIEADWRSRSAYNLPLFPTLENANS